MATTHCTCCERPLKGRIVYLELDQRDDQYKEPGAVPVEHSQGGFPFGAKCAKNQLGK